MDPRLVVKNSAIEGRGVFASAPIKKGEVIVRWGGDIFTIQQVLDGVVDDDTACQIDDGHYIASPIGHGQDDEDYMNHSCDPNTWMEDEVTISAKRHIQTGEEITADYALWVGHPGHVTIAVCRCSARSCRKKITGDDWKLQEVQDRYRGHFPPYLQRRIDGSKRY